MTEPTEAAIAQMPTPTPDRSGFWLCYYSDNSSLKAFGTEIEALRHAVENNMDVRFAKWGEEGTPMTEPTEQEMRDRLRHYQFQRNSGAPSLNKDAFKQTNEQEIMSDLLEIAEFFASPQAAPATCPSGSKEKPMLPDQKKPNLTIEDMAVIPCPACAEPTLHIARGEEKCCLQCAADGGSTMPGYVPLSKFNRWSE